MSDAFIQAAERLIWELNPRALAEQPLVDRRSWAGSVQHALARFGLHHSVAVPQTPAESGPHVAVVMMIKDEADIIDLNLGWLHFIGIRKFIILDNGSTDNTAKLIDMFRERFDDVELLRVDDPIVRYIQAQKTTGLYRMAISVWEDVRWVFPLDADEFLIPQRGLAELGSVLTDVDALTIPKVIHFRHRFRSSVENQSVLGKMGYRSPLFCVPPKLAVRASPGIAIGQGNHQITRPDDEAARYDGGLEYGFYIREFPTRSFEQFVRKIKNGGPAIRSAIDYFGHGVGGDHWLQYHDQLMAGGESRLLEIYNDQWVRDESLGFVMDPFLGCPPDPVPPDPLQTARNADQLGVHWADMSLLPPRP